MAERAAPAPAPNLSGLGVGGFQPKTLSRWRRIDHMWLLLAAALFVVAALYFGFPTRFAPIFRFIWGSFAGGDGVFMTLKLTVISFVFILLVGMLMGVFRVTNVAILQWVSSLYVEIVRGVPVLVWLLWIYFGLPGLLQIKIPDFTAAVIAFTFAYGAYMTEIFRAGIQSIAKGQMEAARSLGMTYIEAMRYIILPQAVRVILPPVSNEFVTLLKDSSLVSILGLADLTRRGREWVGRTFASFDTYAAVAITYLILTLLFTRLSTAIERRLAVEKR